MDLIKAEITKASDAIHRRSLEVMHK
jgi:hypothetical protein